MPSEYRVQLKHTKREIRFRILELVMAPAHGGLSCLWSSPGLLRFCYTGTFILNMAPDFIPEVVGFYGEVPRD